MNKICISSPSRADLSGGAADLFEGKTLSVALDIRALCTIEENNDELLIDRGDGPTSYDAIKGKNYTLIKSILNYFTIDDSITISIKTDIPQSSGLGGSASLSVSIICALNKWYDWNLSRYLIAEIAQRIEVNVMGLRNGYQDQYTSVFGGCAYMDFEGKQNHPIEKEPFGVVEQLPFDYPIVIAHTGVEHNSGDANSPIFDLYSKGDINVCNSILRLDTLTQKLRRAIIDNDIESIASVINENQEIIRGFNRSWQENELCIDAALESGAIAAKVTGAGCGGSIMALCTSKNEAKNVKDTLKNISPYVRICKKAEGARSEF